MRNLQISSSNFLGTLPIPLNLNVLDVIQMDLCRPISPTSQGGNRYIFQIIDSQSHMTLIYLLKTKSECFETFVKFQALVENQTTRTIKTVASNHGGEFLSLRFSAMFSAKGICHLSTAPYTPQKNPVVERGNHSLLERLRVMIHHNSVPAKWWGEAEAIPAFLLNRTPVLAHNFRTPLSMWDTSTSFNLSYLHPFGCTVEMNNPKLWQKSKVKPIGALCVLVEIQEHHHNYQLFDPAGKKILMSHYCHFIDDEAFWPTHPFPSQIPLFIPSIALFNSCNAVEEKPDSLGHLLSALPDDLAKDSVAAPIHSNHQYTSLLPPIEEGCGSVTDPVQQGPDETDRTCEYTLNSDPLFSSIKKSTTLPKGWVCEKVLEKAPKDITSGITNDNIISSGCVRSPSNCFAAAVISKAPCSFKEAMASLKSNSFAFAIQNEFSSLEKHVVFEEVEFHNGLQLLDNMWVFHEKMDSLGNVTGEKSHLCVRGFLQVEDLDFHETFAPTGRHSTLQFLL
ncbi:hypothetical protein O181_017136 [Austropuccinia psidii MF-1]|uniref:Integrase catalytic domain-containing protein n=1 Tax=Austropuccinia psidii MF-1 TaxID=1389203 RepID=A0A9Q3C2Y0_9BASI|nr:hypothetical protein [Austropuccinia psidii MF-1]